MNKLLTILLVIVIVTTSKTFCMEGFYATPSDYLKVATGANLIEYLLWVLLAISFTNLLENQHWFRSTYSFGRSKRIVVNEVGENRVVASEQFSSTPDYKPAKKAEFYSRIAFVSSLIGTIGSSFIL